MRSDTANTARRADTELQLVPPVAERTPAQQHLQDVVLELLELAANMSPTGRKDLIAYLARAALATLDESSDVTAAPDLTKSEAFAILALVPELSDRQRETLLSYLKFPHPPAQPPIVLDHKPLP